MRKKNNKITHQTIKLGSFEVESGKLRVSDPCYDKKAWCAGIVKNVITGTWKAKVKKIDDGQWGNRCRELLAYHDNHKPSKLKFYIVLNFPVGVDSGQAGIFDDKFYKVDYKTDYLKVGELEYYKMPNVQPQITKDWYEICCDKTLSNIGAGVIRNGVVSASGYGDGEYRAYIAKDAYGKVVAIKIKF